MIRYDKNTLLALRYLYIEPPKFFIELPRNNRPSKNLSWRVETLKKNENAWKSAENQNDYENNLNCIFNKITYDNFDVLIEEIVAKILENKIIYDVIKRLVHFLINKVLLDEKYIVLYIDLYIVLSFRLGKHINRADMKKILLDHCNFIFDEGNSDEIKKYNSLLETDEQIKKRRFNNIICFFGELYIKDVIKCEDIIYYLKKMEDNIIALCKVLLIIGKKLSESKLRNVLGNYISKLNQIYKDKSYESRLRFQCIEVIEAGKNNWQTNSTSNRGPLNIKNKIAQKEKTKQNTNENIKDRRLRWINEERESSNRKKTDRHHREQSNSSYSNFQRGNDYSKEKYGYSKYDSGKKKYYRSKNNL